jgi:YesN/AraC family two-component response regulator
MMSETIKIVLVDDELFRKGISFFYWKEDNIEVVYEASMELS